MWLGYQGVRGASCLMCVIHWAQRFNLTFDKLMTRFWESSSELQQDDGWWSCWLRQFWWKFNQILPRIVSFASDIVKCLAGNYCSIDKRCHFKRVIVILTHYNLMPPETEEYGSPFTFRRFSDLERQSSSSTRLYFIFLTFTKLFLVLIPIPLCMLNLDTVKS